jgi:hypothetical protein
MARFEGGWIKLYRSAIESDIGGNAYCLAIFIRLLSWACLKPATIRFNGCPREIPRGALIIGIRELAERVGCARETTYRHLIYLEKRDTIQREVGTEGTLIRITNFERYQGSDEEAGHERNTEGALTNREVGREPNPIEEVKKGRRKKGRFDYPDDFEKAFDTYPRREGKQLGFKIYQREIKTADDQASLLTAVENYSRAKQGTEPRYLLMFSSFMGQWGDWLDVRAGTTTSATINTKPISLEGDVWT